MTKLRKKLTEKTRKFGAEVRRRHSTGLTPESEKYYEHVPATFPSDWYDYNGPGCDVISLKYANGLRNGANSDTHRCKQLTEHGEERCIKLREVAGFSAVRTIFQIVGPRKILHCLLGK